MKLRKLISSALILSLAASFAAACGDSSAAPADETAANTAETAEITETTDDGRVKGPEPVDLGGYTLRIADWAAFKNMIFREELTGEAVNDALYNADAEVMEKYNCKIEVKLAADFPDVKDTVAQSVLAGMDEFDLSYSHDCYTVANVLAGCFLDLRDNDTFNFDAPWWTDTKNTFTIGGKMYFASSYLSYSPLYLGMILCYNKDIAENYGIGISYDKIFDGDWYMDDMIGMVQNMNIDIDGDGKMTLGTDQYGFISNALGLVNFQVSQGNAALAKDEEGYLVLSTDEERLYTMLSKFERVMEFGVDTISDGRWDYGMSYFGEGQGLFNYAQITGITKIIKDKNIRVGILPVPKLDENQKEYISGAFDMYWAIPITAGNNIDKIATILEAKSQKCFYDVLPVSFETALQVRFSDSPDDAKMYEIIRDTMVVDPGYAFNEQNGGISNLIHVLTWTTSGKLSSYIEKNIKTAQKGLDIINDTIRNLG